MGHTDRRPMYVARTAPIVSNDAAPIPTVGTQPLSVRHARALQVERVVLPQTGPLTDPYGSGVTVSAPSLADGPWEIDWARAHRDAQTVINSLDFTKPDLFIWCSGTGATRLDTPVAQAIYDAWRDGSVSATSLQYPSNWNLRSSVPTGIATLKLVLAEIARRGGGHRVLLSGVSQGAWLIGETMADPAVNGVVHRAVIMGHPYLAKSQYVDGHDPKVEVVNHADDIVTVPVRGHTGVMDAIEAVLGTKRSLLGAVPQAILGNLHLLGPALRVGLFAIPLLGGIVGNPHEYGHEMPRIVRRLKDGVPLTTAPSR